MKQLGVVWRINGLYDGAFDQRLRVVKLPSLKCRRMAGELIQTYKILYNVDDVDISHFFNLTNDDKQETVVTKFH